MRKFLVLVFPLLLSACAAPRVDVAKPSDEELSCGELAAERSRAAEAAAEAKNAKVKSALAFGLIGYLAAKDEANEAEAAAKSRIERLDRIAAARGCPGSGE